MAQPIDASYARAQAKYYLNQASNASGPDKINYQLKALDVLMVNKRFEPARAIAFDLEQQTLTTPQMVVLKIAQAELSLSQGSHVKVLRKLAELDGYPVPSDKALDLLLIKSKSELALDRNADALETRIALDKLYPERDPRKRDNLIETWQIMNQLSSYKVSTLRSKSLTARGWVDLFHIIAHRDSNPNIVFQLRRWAREYPQHPAYQLFASRFVDLEADYAHFNNAPQIKKIAVMLPERGAYAPFSDAIKAGVMAAFYHDTSNQKPEIDFIDSGDESAIKQSLQQAQGVGADVVIGPLTKDALKKVSQQPLSAPVVALNRLEQGEGYHDNLFQLSLDPEDEVVELANLALSRGHLNALIITADSDYGRRIANSFTRVWQQYGGNVLQEFEFQGTKDLRGKIRSLLNIDKSQERINLIGSVIKQKPETVLRRRHDADMILMAANPVMARQIKPLLDFYFAKDLPVYATANIFGQEINADLDLNGITFCDVPWRFLDSHPGVDKELANQLQAPTRSLERMHALGVDAYHIAKNIRKERYLIGIAHPRATGTLRLSDNLVYQRTLPCAQIAKKNIKLL